MKASQKCAKLELVAWTFINLLLVLLLMVKKNCVIFTQDHKKSQKLIGFLNHIIQLNLWRQTNILNK